MSLFVYSFNGWTAHLPGQKFDLTEAAYVLVTKGRNGVKVALKMTDRITMSRDHR
jgi:hypothetical protein